MAEYFTKDGDDYKKVEDELLPKSTVNGIIEKRLEQQKRNEFSDYDELKEKAAKFDTTTKEFETKLKTVGDEKLAIETKLGEAKLETVKVKAIHEFKLSDDLSEFLNGADEETIRSQAEKLSKGIPGGSVVVNKETKPGGTTSDTKVAAQGLFGKKSDD